MALAFETGGYGYAPALVPVDQQALQGLKPLSFSGGGQSPVQFQPLAGWSVPSSHPELIAQGVASGLGSIAQGITAAYKSKQDQEREDAKEKKKEAREDILLKQEYAEKEKIAGIRGQNAIDLAELRDGIKDRTPKQSSIEKDSTDLRLPSLKENQESPALQNSELPHSDFMPIKSGVNYNTLPTDEQINEMQGGDGENPPEPDMSFKENPLGNITSPVPLAAAPSARGEQALNALGSIDWSQVKGSLGAGTGAGASPVNVQAIQPDWLRSPKSVRAENLGGLDKLDLPLNDVYLSELQKGLADTKVPTIPEYEEEIGNNYKAIPTETAKNIKRYAIAKGIEPPQITGVGQGMMKVEWPKGMTPFQSMKQKNFDQRLAYGVSNTLKSEPKAFEAEDNVKNYMGQRGLMQMLVRLSPTYEAAMKDPEHNAIPAAGMAQLMAQAETGGVPTVSSVEEYLHSQGITDTLEQMKAKYLAGGKETLTPRQTTQMYELLLEEAKAQASLANQTVGAWQDTYKGRGVKNPEKYIAPFILPKTKAEANQEINDMIPEIAKAKAKRDKLEKSGDAEAFAAADKEWRDMSKHAIDLKTKVDKTMGHIVNYHDILNTRQGFLAPVPINELSKDAFNFMKSNEMSNLNPAEQQFYMGGSSAKPSDDSE